MFGHRLVGRPQIAACLALSLILMAGHQPAVAADVTDQNAFEKSATAATAADHEALVAYFRGKAEAAGKEAKHHKQMLAAVMNGRNYAAMLPHCTGLIHSNEEAQKSYQDLANLHSEQAKRAGK